MRPAVLRTARTQLYAAYRQPLRPVLPLVITHNQNKHNQSRSYSVMSNPNPHPVSSAPTAAPVENEQINTQLPPAEQKEKKQQQQQGQKKEKKAKPAAQGNAQLELSPPPEFFDTRNAIFDKYKKIYDDKVAGTLGLTLQGAPIADQSRSSS
jgi:hypothetical protein